MKKILFVITLFLLASCETEAQSAYTLPDSVVVEIEDFTYVTDKEVFISTNADPIVIHDLETDISYIEDRRIVSVGGSPLYHFDYDLFNVYSTTGHEMVVIKGAESQLGNTYTIHSGSTLKKFNFYVFDAVTGDMLMYSIFRQII